MRRFLPALAAAAFYLVVALVLFAPVLGRFSTHCLAHPQSELNMKVWDQWRTSQGLVRDHTIPQEVPFIDFPRGGVLFPSDPLNCVLFLPVHVVAGPAARYNISPLVHLVLAALGAYFLALYLTGSQGGALLAGTAFGFNPFLLTYGVETACSEAVCVVGFPLFLLFLVRTVREGSLLNPVLAAACCGVLATSSVYYGQFALLLLFVFLVYLAVAVRRAEHLTLDPALLLPSTGIWNRALAARLLLFALVAGLLTVPFAVVVRRSVTSPRSVLPQEEFARRDGGFDRGAASLSCSGVITDLVRMGKGAMRERLIESRFVFATYSGVVLLGLALLSLRRRSRFLLFCAGSALMFLVLFAGPYFRVSDSILCEGPWNLPYVAFFRFFPMFSSILEPFRLHVLFTLFVVLMAASGLGRVAAGSGKETGAGILASLLFLAELLVVSPVPFPLSVTELSHPSACRALAEDPRVYAVLDLPFHYRGGSLFYKKVFYFQTLHGRAIPNRVAYFPHLLEESALYRALVDFEARKGGSLHVEGAAAEFTRLGSMGFGRILVHREAYEPDTAAGVSRFLRLHLGSPLDLGEGVDAYDLPGLRK